MPNLYEPGDELTQGLNCVSQNLLYIQWQLSQLAVGITGQPSNPDPVTCAQLSGLLNATNAWLYQISLAIKQASAGGGGGTPLDLTGVISALVQIGIAAQSYPPVWNAIAALLGDKLDGIATAVSSTGSTDLKPLVDAVNKLFTTIDVPLPVYQQLEQDGWISAETLSQLGQGEFGTGIITTFKDYVTRGLAWIIKEVESPHGPEFAPAFKAEDGIAKFLSGLVDLTLNAASVPFYPIVKGAIDGVATQLVPSRPTVIGDVFVDEELLITKTLVPVLIVNSVALVAGYFGWNTSEQLKEYVDVVSGIVGLEEISELTVGSRMRAGPMREAEMRARALYRQELPGAGALMGLVAQGLLDGTRALNLIPYTGTPAELVDPLQLAAYRGLNPRQMLRLIETNLFSDAEIAAELTFSAMRPASQARMLRAAPYLATAPQRSSLLAAAEAAAVAGLLSDSDLTSQVDAAETNDDRDSLILARVHLQQLTQEAKDLEAEYTTLFVGGVIDDATFRANLAAIGLQPWKVNTVAGKAEARANSTLHRKELAQAAAVARKTAGEEQQAAIRNFMSGGIDAAALLAALIATGLTPTQAAAMTDLSVLRKSGALRWQYGQQLSPAQATLLRDRVAALTDQRKRLQITDAQFVADLQALGIGDRYVNALQAAADALISPKTAAFAIPVKTN